MKKRDFSEKNIRRPVRGLLLGAAVLCLLLLSACAESGRTADTHELTVTASAGSGMYWSCELDPEGIVRFSETRIDPEQLTYGAHVQYRYVFTGTHYGETEVRLTYRKQSDDSLKVVKTCGLTVDRENNVTGTGVETKLYIAPGEGYSLNLSDDTAVTWIENDGTFIFTPQAAGAATAVFTRKDGEDQGGTKRSFYITVAEDLNIEVEEQLRGSGNSSFESLTELENSLGFSMKIPADAEILELSGVDGIGFVSFRWKDMEVAFTGGAIDVSEFFTGEGSSFTVGDVSVGVPIKEENTAGWEKDGIGYHVVCSSNAGQEMLKQLLSEML